MIHTITIDDSYDLIIVGGMSLAVAPKFTDPFTGFISTFIGTESFPILYREEVAILLEAIEQGIDAKGKRWELKGGVLSGLAVDLKLLAKALVNQRYLYKVNNPVIPLDDEQLFRFYGRGLRTLSGGIIPILGITSPEFVFRDEVDGCFRRIDDRKKAASSQQVYR